MFLVDAWLQAERPGKRSSIPDRSKCCLHSRMSRSILDLNRPPIQCVPCPPFCRATRPAREPLYFRTLPPLPRMTMHSLVQYRNTAVPSMLLSRTVLFPVRSFIQLCNNLLRQLTLRLLMSYIYIYMYTYIWSTYS